jgi:hypothetical protein
VVQPATLDHCDPYRPVFVVGKGAREGKGGGAARLAFEVVIGRQGAGRLYGLLTELHKYAQPPQIGILLP